jgi:hypothetical protein
MANSVCMKVGFEIHGNACIEVPNVSAAASLVRKVRILDLQETLWHLRLPKSSDPQE